MQDKNFEDIKERIETGLGNNFPPEARLIMLGEIFCSLSHGLITPNQAYELEDLLGLKQFFQNYDQLREIGAFGETFAVA
ncbi:hypothetical protein RIF25_04450 [Thermosynechococcaceae cyanobacterium BACA0444]|uniref:Uncharacterized protein n=1 Tax=Pseudocalidococcus azoricus BACA0444 TaxID=2918990 RepID=A0AAE4JXK8_9CYAN|nr:hypothetical protein [Pseudocalidococcus azoricus]MDS3860054.1 hypothetical protein [Pseudocalidococcus azoricus BACA0444]